MAGSAPGYGRYSVSGYRNGIKEKEIDMKDKIKSKIFLVTGTLLILAALSLTGYNIWADHKAGKQSLEALTQIHQQWENASEEVNFRAEKNVFSGTEQRERKNERKGKKDSGKRKTETSTQTPLYKFYPDMEMPVMEVEGKRYIGVLSLPKLEVELPVMETWDYPKLRTAPCRYKGSVYKDNVIIAAHNYTRHFGSLHTMQPGDEVEFTDADGNLFSYEVVSMETLPGTAVEEMESGDWDMTLFTCTYGGKSRVTVRCEKKV